MMGNVRKTFRNSHLGKRMSALFLCAALVLGLSACGKSGDGTEDSAFNDELEVQDTVPLVYEPEDFKLEIDGEYNLYNVRFVGDTLCFPVYLEDEVAGGYYVLHRQSLTGGTITDIPMVSYANVWTLGEDGSLYMIDDEVSIGENSENFHIDRFLVKQNEAGEQVFRQDITELLSEEFYQLEIAVDAEGRIYLLTGSNLFLFDEKGNPGGTVRTGLSEDIYTCNFGRGSDGKVYLSGGTDSTTLYEVNYEAAQLNIGYPNFPAWVGSSMSWDMNGNFLAIDSMGVYRYNIENQKTETLFLMADTGIEGKVLGAVVGGLSDGRIAIVWWDWEIGKGGVVLMTGTAIPEPAEEQEKKELILGVMRTDPFLAAAVSEFNRQNDTYKIKIKTYMQEGEIYMIDGVTRLQTDIAAGNCPDIFEVDTYTMDWKNLVEKGVFEDLAPYLEQSEVLNREELLENVMNAYTYEGVLVTIPAVIQIQGFFGSADELGDNTGWTIDDVIAFSDAHPDAELIDGANSTYIMRFLLLYSMDSFVDWENGTCNFDGDEFKKLLAFAARFSKPLTIDGGADQKPWMEKVRDGELLLRDVDMYEVENVQVYADPFPGGVTAIGYPSPDGSPVYSFYGCDSLAISARSEAKEAAWDFIENYLTRDGHRFHMGFSVIKDKFDEMIDKAMEIKLDENGNEIVSQLVLGDGLTYTYRCPTQEEIDMILYMIDHGRPLEYSSTQLMNIIYEEAEAFFQNQMTLDKVAENIQRRAAVYVSENS